MPFWKKAPVKQGSDESGTNGVNGDGGKPKEKVDYKARLQHKQYIVSVTNTLLVKRKRYHENSCSIKNLYRNLISYVCRLKKVRSRCTT